MGRVSTAYLIIYNIFQTICWSGVLLKATAALLTKGTAGVYTDAGAIVRFCQGAAALEVLHAATGMVKGSPIMAAVQWAGRSNCLFAVLHCIPQLWTSPAVASLLLAWALSEVVRYPWYAANLLHAAPGWLTWVRYSFFVPLYPIGVASEMWLLLRGMPYIRARGLHSVALPNKLNFAFDYYFLTAGLLALYLPAWWRLYSHMLKARRKRLGASRNMKED